MKKTLLLVFLCLASLFQLYCQEDIYCRPVKHDVEQQDLCVLSRGDTVKVFQDEWFQTIEKGNQNIILGEDTLVNDGKPSSFHQNYSWPESNPCLVNAINAVRVIDGHQAPEASCFKLENDSDTLFFMIIQPDSSSWRYRIIDQTDNKVIKDDTLRPSDKYIPVSGDAGHVYRVSVENHVPCVIKNVITVSAYNPEDSVLVYFYQGDLLSEESGVTEKFLIHNEDRDTLKVTNSVSSYFAVDTIKTERNPDYVPPVSPGPHIPLWMFIAAAAILILIAAAVFLIFRKRIPGGGGEVTSDVETSPAKVPAVSDIKKEEESVSVNHEDRNEEENLSLDDLLNKIADETLKNQIIEAVKKEREDHQAEIGEVEKEKKNAEAREVAAKQSAEKFEASWKSAKSQYDDLYKQWNELSSKFDDKVAAVKENCQKEIDRVKKEADKEVKKAEEAKNAAEKKAAGIKQELEAAHERVVNKLNSDLKTVKGELGQAIANFNNTKSKLEYTTTQLTAANGEIVRLNKAQEEYKSKLTYVPFAADYTGKVNRLLEIGDNVLKSAVAMLSINGVKDYYHIMKAISKFEKVVASVDTAQLYTDVRMIMKGQMVLTGTVLSSFDQKNAQDSLKNSAKRYFFDSYLSKYIDALVVLNETCLAMNLIVDGLSAADVKAFKTYSTQIADAARELEIVVETTHLFDKVGEKIDLQVTLVDAGFVAGDILEIENCFVYLKGNDRPKGKIKVKAQL